jgi:hypothetical protein
VAAAAAFLAAYNAKKAGVKDYVSQYMFNNPRGTSPAMDLAKILAKIHLIEGLNDDDFHAYRDARTGLNSLPLDMDQAKGHIGSSIHTMMASSSSGGSRTSLDRRRKIHGRIRGPWRGR